MWRRSSFTPGRFDTGNWAFAWGLGSAATKNSTTGVADHLGASNLSCANASNTYRYTFRIKESDGAWYRGYTVMETASKLETLAGTTVITICLMWRGKRL